MKKGRFIKFFKVNLNQEQTERIKREFRANCERGAAIVAQAHWPFQEGASGWLNIALIDRAGANEISELIARIKKRRAVAKGRRL